MRRTPVACFVILGALTAAALTSGTEEGKFHSMMKEAMAGMHRDMMAHASSGDPDHAFVRMMVPHHQGAVDMSRALLLYGKDRELQQLAKSIIAEQQNEIQLMKLWLARHPPQPWEKE